MIRVQSLLSADDRLMLRVLDPSIVTDDGKIAESDLPRAFRVLIEFADALILKYERDRQRGWRGEIRRLRKLRARLDAIQSSMKAVSSPPPQVH